MKAYLTLLEKVLGPQIRDDARAVRVGFHVQPHEVGQREPHIGIEGATFDLDEATLLHLALTAAG